jgi:hypothetical protein
VRRTPARNVEELKNPATGRSGSSLSGVAQTPRGEAGRREALGTPEQAQRSLQAWLAWTRDLEAKGDAHLERRSPPGR